MDHFYQFFDRAIVDSIWNASWKALSKRNPSIAWLKRKTRTDDDGYYGNSLRELLAFCIDSEEWQEQIDWVLRTRKVSETLKRCSPQLFAMNEVMDHALPNSKRFTACVEIRDPFGLISIAGQGFCTKRISAATLWAVLKLHSISNLRDIEQSPSCTKRIRSLLPWDRIWNPIYKWQKKQSENEEWANCLGVSDTRRFISFVLEAHQGNWATHDLQTGGTHRFKDDPDCVTLARTVKKLKKFKRPSVSRRFS